MCSSDGGRKRGFVIHLTSKCMRSDPLFLRNEYAGCGRWEIPLVKKQPLNLDGLSLIACSDTRAKDIPANTRKGVHFFVDDYRFHSVYAHPGKSLAKYGQYAFLLTPDFSLYADMNPWRQMESVAKNRWCGAFWQSKGFTVIPTVSWSTPGSFSFCFDGVEEGSIVAVGMIGCKRNRLNFMRGYQAMLERIRPEAVICFGEPFPEMRGNVVTVDYRASRRAVR